MNERRTNWRCHCCVTYVTQQWTSSHKNFSIIVTSQSNDSASQNKSKWKFQRRTTLETVALSVSKDKSGDEFILISLEGLGWARVTLLTWSRLCFRHEKLFFNCSKTHYILITKQKSMPTNDFIITLNDHHQIAKAYLGVKSDNSFATLAKRRLLSACAKNCWLKIIFSYHRHVVASWETDTS